MPEELNKISTEMAELLRAKNQGGFSGQGVTSQGLVVNSSLAVGSNEQSIIATGTGNMPATNAPAESGVSNVTSPTTSYVVKSIPRTGGHW